MVAFLSQMQIWLQTSSAIDLLFVVVYIIYMLVILLFISAFKLYLYC